MKDNEIVGTYYNRIYKKLTEKNMSYSQVKLHKILYFSLAYILSNNENSSEENSFFKNVKFEAWTNGPVEPEARKKILYDGGGVITIYLEKQKMENRYEDMKIEEKEAIDEVVELMGGLSAIALSYLTHHDIFKNAGDTPWKKVNSNGQWCNQEIPREEIKNFYTKEWFDSFKENKDGIYKILEF